MTNIKKSNFIKNLSIFLCLVPMLVLSIFCLVPNSKNIDLVSADNTVVDYTFNGSNLVVQGALMNNSKTNFNTNAVYNVRFTFTYANGSYISHIYGAYLASNRTSVVNFHSSFALTDSGVKYELGSVIDQYTMVIVYSTRVGDITGAINRVVLSYDDIGHYNTITYYDDNGSYITFGIFTYTENAVVNAFKFDTRTYYINLSFDNNAIYQVGYADGYNTGVSDGSSSGYNAGYNAGFNVGYADGYVDGEENGGSYTFMSLIGSVIDVPVNAFTSLLNFEVLGVNLLAFITGLLTLAVVIFIVKLCIGGK